MSQNELLVKVSNPDYTASALNHYETVVKSRGKANDNDICHLVMTERTWEGGGYGQIKTKYQVKLSCFRLV